jgi:HSP20 family protein
MPNIIRKTNTTIVEAHRGVMDGLRWPVRSANWSPPTDLFETDNGYVIRVEIGGMRDEDIEVAYNEGIIMITGVRREKPERRAYHQMELRFGKFAVAVGLPGLVDVENSVAEYADGFLTVSMPKIIEKGGV